MSEYADELTQRRVVPIKAPPGASLQERISVLVRNAAVNQPNFKQPDVLLLGFLTAFELWRELFMFAPIKTPDGTAADWEYHGMRVRVLSNTPDYLSVCYETREVE